MKEQLIESLKNLGYSFEDETDETVLQTVSGIVLQKNKEQEALENILQEKEKELLEKLEIQKQEYEKKLMAKQVIVIDEPNPSRNRLHPRARS